MLWQASFLTQNRITYPIAFQTFHLKACPKSGNPVYPSFENFDTPDKYEYLFQHSASSSTVSYMSLVRVTFLVPSPIFALYSLLKTMKNYLVLIFLQLLFQTLQCKSHFEQLATNSVNSVFRSKLNLIQPAYIKDIRCQFLHSIFLL